MRGRRDWDWVPPLIIGGFLVLQVLFLLVEALGVATSLLVVVPAGIGSYFLLRKALPRLSTWHLARRKCRHGVRGAVAAPETCLACQDERLETARRMQAWEDERKAKQEALRAKLEAERQANYRAWVEKTRLPAYLAKMDPIAFEDLTCLIFEAQGYAVEKTPVTGDGGVDAYLRRSGTLSLLQCKRVQGSVGAPVLRELFGVMQMIGAHEGIVVTTGSVSKPAKVWAGLAARAKTPIRIIELDELLTMIKEYLVEAEVIPPSFMLSAADHSERGICPKCGGRLRSRKGKYGRFRGCSNFPNCRYTADKGRR